MSFWFTLRMFVDEISEVLKELKCVILGTIKSIQEEEGWYYLACRKCNYKAVPKSSFVDLEDIDGSDSNDVKDNTSWCRTCRSVANSIVPRVQDGTGTASFVLLHLEVFKLTDHSFIDILERQHRDGEVDGIAKQLDLMLNKRLIFKIDLSDFNIRTCYGSYIVLKLCDDNDAMESMVRDSDVHQDVVALESTKNDESSHACFDSKDVVSCTGDSLAQTNAEDSSQSIPPTKRVRETDDKEMDHHSSTKKKLVTVKIEKP